MKPSAILLWTFVQLISLGCICFGISFWAHHPVPRESIAVEIVVISQIASSSLLYPALFPNWRTSIINTVLAIPFVFLAGLISTSATDQRIAASLIVLLWLAGLAWLQLTSNGRFPQVLIVLLSLGGVLLAYIRLETVADGGGISHVRAYGSVVAAVSILSGPGRNVMEWGEVGLPMMIAVVVFAWNRWKSAGTQITTSPHNDPSEAV